MGRVGAAAEASALETRHGSFLQPSPPDVKGTRSQIPFMTILWMGVKHIFGLAVEAGHASRPLLDYISFSAALIAISKAGTLTDSEKTLLSVTVKEINSRKLA